jgi:hypothetical protein
VTARLQRPARGRRGVFQRLEKKFPIIGKIGPFFPTIGKIFSNHWKNTENFFQSLENGGKYFWEKREKGDRPRISKEGRKDQP